MKRVPQPDSLNLVLFGATGGSFFNNLVRKAVKMLAPEVNIIAVVASSNAARAEREGEKLGIPFACMSLNDLIEHAAEINVHGVLNETPNAAHADIALRCAAEAQLANCCDKPIAHCFADAKKMAALQASQPTMALYTYQGSAPWLLAGEIIRSGVLGALLQVRGLYEQKWLGKRIEAAGQRQAIARTKKEIVGPYGCLIDIGIHVVRTAQATTGKDIATVDYCKPMTHVAGRDVDDHVIMHGTLNGGVPVSIEAIQVGWNDGGCNDHSCVFNCDGGSLRISQKDTEALQVTIPGLGTATLERGEDYTSHPVLGAVFAKDRDTKNFWGGSYPSRHPEGIIDSLARLIGAWGTDVITWKKTGALPKCPWYPTFVDGAKDWAVVEAIRLGDQEARGFPQVVPAI